MLAAFCVLQIFGAPMWPKYLLAEGVMVISVISRNSETSLMEKPGNISRHFIGCLIKGFC